MKNISFNILRVLYGKKISIVNFNQRKQKTVFRVSELNIQLFNKSLKKLSVFNFNKQNIKQRLW